MNKKSSEQSMSYKKELINSIEPNYIFSKKPLNRFKLNQIDNGNKNFSKNNQINDLRKLINSIHNCNLKNNSKNLVLGDGKINSPIMIVGEAPGAEEEKTGMTFQGESGAPRICSCLDSAQHAPRSTPSHQGEAQPPRPRARSKQRGC